jgi:hypothetical protein
MLHLLQLLIKNCKLAVFMDRSTIRLTANGPLAVIAATVILVVFILWR